MACRFNFHGCFFLRISLIFLTVFILLPASGRAFDHQVWDELLKTHTEDGLVDYASFQNDSDKLDQYLKSLSEYPLAMLAEETREGRIALWVNAFNALVIQEVLRHYPVDSVSQIENFWEEKRPVVSGLVYNFKEIRDEILRNTFRDERALLALSAGEMSSPPLRSEAYEGSRLAEQFSDQMNFFLTHVRYNKLVEGKKKLRLSPLLKEFAGDFLLGYGRSEGVGKFSAEEFAVLNFVKIHLKDPKIQDWIVQSKYKVSYLKKDERLNDTQFLEKKENEN